MNIHIPHARGTDPETSHAAASSIDLDKLRRSQMAIYMFMMRFPDGMTDTQLIERYQRSLRDAPGLFPKQSESGIRTRRKEMVERGVLMDSGERAVLASGRKSIIWKIA